MTTPPPSHGQPLGPDSQPGYPRYGAPQGPYGPPTPRPPVQVWDIVLTIVFLVALAVLTPFASFLGLFLVMASDSCGAGDCSTELITIGWLLGTLLPWVVLIATAIVSIVFMVKRKLAFYIPLLGAVGVGVALILGFVVAGAGALTS